jgi:hypothetical protein
MNWKVRYYDKHDKLIESFLIKDRTEHEAENEAMAQMPSECEDWTMMSVVEKKSEVNINILN